MPSILTDLSTPALADANKNNLYEFFRILGRIQHGEFSEHNGLTRWHTRLLYPWFNGVLASRNPLPNEARAIQETTAYFKSKSVSHFTWWLAPETNLAEWQNVLHSQGFIFNISTPGMAVDLHALADVKTKPNIKIVPVTDTHLLKIWSRVFVQGYELPHIEEQNINDVMADLGFDLPIRNYLGYLNDEPAATSTLYLGAGVAGVYCVATMPHARGQGVGAATTLEPLLEAAQMNYRVGILQSSDMGFNVYRKLGFETVCQMEHFYYRMS